MKRGQTYTTIFNLRNSQVGHLFQGRFKSILVENEAYLLQLSYYIHRNPLRAGIVQRLIDYPWSSYPAYAYDRRSPDWLKTDLLLAQFGPKNTRRISKSDMINRDILLYHLWQSGRFSNSEIGSQVGLTISSVSRRVGIFEAMLSNDKKLQLEYKKLKSIIKV
jgi:hypothetical protein